MCGRRPPACGMAAKGKKWGYKWRQLIDGSVKSNCNVDSTTCNVRSYVLVNHSHFVFTLTLHTHMHASCTLKIHHEYSNTPGNHCHDK